MRNRRIAAEDVCAAYADAILERKWELDQDEFQPWSVLELIENAQKEIRDDIEGNLYLDYNILDA
jgi:hypothetical protein